MSGIIINGLARLVQRFEYTIQLIISRGFPPGPLYALDCNNFIKEQPIKTPKFSLKDIIGDGFLWGVPTCRGTIERRLNRRFGVPKYVWKPLVPKTHLLMCPTCGHDYEAGRLCGRCYEKVKLETKEMQEAIQENLGLEPVEKEVIVLYEGEIPDKSDTFWKNQKIVELPKPRPKWFHQNLLESATTEPSNTKDVKPANLA